MTGAGVEVAAELVGALRGWAAPDAERERLREEYLSFLDERGVSALRRGGAEHVTASCFIFSADLRRTVLAFHRKGRFWAQTGGHVEPADVSVRAAALREAREEAGLKILSVVPGVLDLDRHALSASFGSCRTHWDVGFAAVAGLDEPPRVSDESEAVAWFPVDRLPTPAANSVGERVRLFRRAVLATRGQTSCSSRLPSS